jgi:hypothetical protein
MLHRVGLVRTDVPEELGASFIRVTRIDEFRTLAVSRNRSTLMKEALTSSETSVLIRATRRNIPEGSILRSHRCENLKSYKVITMFSVQKYIRFVTLFKSAYSCDVIMLLLKADHLQYDSVDATGRTLLRASEDLFHQVTKLNDYPTLSAF